VAAVRQGKFFEVDLEGVPADKARETAEEIARRVLSNPVIESFRVEVEP
jgi:phosphoribosylformylglycinamidine synthase